jgi:hypothetical protein
MKIWDIVLARLSEKSTWAGLLGLLALGFSAELNESIYQLIIAFVSVVAVLVKEQKK